MFRQYSIRQFIAAAALVVFATTLGAPKTVRAASGKVNCAPDAIARLSPHERKRAEFMCKRMQKRRAADAGMAKRRAGWAKKNVRGEAMEKVFQANHRVMPAVEDLGDAVVWKYRSIKTGDLLHTCKEYVFNGGGSRLKSRRVFACN
jgi:hypothetical protein